MPAGVLRRLRAEHAGLRESGMSAKLEILVNKLQDCVYVPVQAISPDGGKQICYLPHGLKPERREVQIGEFNDEFIEVKNGLKEGDRVLLRAPAALEQPKPDKEQKPQENKKEQQVIPAAAPAQARKA